MTRMRRCRARHPEFADWLLRNRCLLARGHRDDHVTLVAGFNMPADGQSWHGSTVPMPMFWRQ